MSRKYINTYVNFVCNAYANRYPNVVDKFLSNNKDKIKEVLDSFGVLKRDFPVKRLYRGVLVDPDSLESRDGRSFLKPLDKIQYLSFTEDREIAEYFADTGSDMSGMVMSLHPNYKGYIITHVPSVDEILIHWRWSILLRIPDMLENAGITGANSTILEQREITLWQRGHEFEVIPYEKN